MKLRVRQEFSATRNRNDDGITKANLNLSVASDGKSTGAGYSENKYAITYQC
jgi:hypothetical protein